jgi:hypothetical protein
MCFGPVASFTASAFLASMGALVLKNIRCRKELWFAAFPLLFALQQLLEGFLWLAFRNNASDGLKSRLSLSYLFFAYGLWPILCPVSVYAIEYDKGRKKILRVFIFLGVLASGYLLHSIFTNPVYAWVAGCSLRYETFVEGPFWFTGIYVAAVLAPYFLSTQKPILLFGAPNAVFLVVTLLAFRFTFISVWCFFAALISANLYIALKKLHHEPLLTVKIPSLYKVPSRF